jgi:limonene-1,2-epoxide hydrolase
MGKQQEDFIAAFCDLWGDGSLEKKPQVEKILSMMSEDAEWQLWVPGGPVYKGKAALRDEINRQVRIATNNKCNIINVLSNDRMVMQERADTAVIFGKYCPHSMVAVYELDENGLIQKWREYIDMADLMQRMGVDAEMAGAGG